MLSKSFLEHFLRCGWSTIPFGYNLDMLAHSGGGSSYSNLGEIFMQRRNLLKVPVIGAFTLSNTNMCSWQNKHG